MIMSQSLSIIAAGDLGFADIEEKVDFAYAQSVLEDVMPVLDQADFRIINLENPLTNETDGIKKTGPCLRGIPKNVGFLKAGNFDCAILANNHTGDYGEQGVFDTIQILEDNEIKYVGAGKDIDTAYQPLVFEKDGVTVALIAAAENEFGGATATKAGMAGFQIGRMYAAIQKAKKHNDFVLVVFHGGNEFNPLPSPGAKERYHLFVDFGADAVIGMHTHCQQGYEYYHEAPIVYSTGNFWFRSHNPDNSDPWYYGYLPQITFVKGERPALEVHPYRLTENFGPLELLKDEKKENMMARLSLLSEMLQDDKTVEDYFKGWCMISGPEYVAYLDIDMDKLQKKELTDLEHFYFLLNDFTCEAHNELMKGILKIAHNDEYDFANEMAEKVRKLQKIGE